MKITRISMKNGEMGQPTSVEMASVVERMHNEKVLDAQEQPALVFSATFSRQGIHDMKHMTGLLLMTAKADKRQQTGEWLKEVRQVPYTLLAFRSLDRRELNVVVPVARVDGQEAQNAEEYLHLLQTAQQQAAAVYHSLTGCPLMVQQELTLHSGCLMSYDPECHYHADAQPFPVIIKSEDVLAGYRDAEVAEDGSVNYQSDEDERDRLRMEYYSCLHQVFEQHAADASDEQLLVTLAELCRKAGLEEEPCVMRTLWQSRFEVCEDMVRKIFRTAYSQTNKGRPLQLMNQKERIARTIRDFFDRRYQLRYNEVKQVTEFRPNDHRFLPWRPLTDRDLKRIAFEEMLEGGHGWMIDIELYVGSSLIRRYNPIHEFLSGVGEWDRQHNYIEEYARRLKTDYDRWPHYFHRWLLAMVAQALDMSRDYGNSMVPLLIGSQAMKKSTFCKNILPYSLREYYMDDIKMDNAEQVERVLGRMWLVNIDEYNAKTDREQAKIKRLLTEKDVQVRKMRSDQYTMTPRLCSFIATTNDRQPLTDPTGSRRYLCVEMTGEADMTGTINYRQMYAQAVWELNHGKQYWFDHDDEREITEHNAKYQLRTSIEDILSSLYEPADKQKEHLLTTTTIQKQLRRHLTAADVPPIRRLGIALKRLHFPEGSHGGLHGYYMHLRE